mgnify:CR=1 FL=1
MYRDKITIFRHYVHDDQTQVLINSSFITVQTIYALNKFESNSTPTKSISPPLTVLWWLVVICDSA